MARRRSSRSSPRVPRADGLQDAAVGGRAGGAPAARAPRGLRPRPSSPPPSSSTSSSSAEARLRRSRRALRRLRGPARDAARRSTTTRAARSWATTHRPTTSPAWDVSRSPRGRGDGRVGRAGPRHRAPRHRRPLREHDLRDAERRLAPELARSSPRLGWPLGTRAQMFWLEEGSPRRSSPGTGRARRCVRASRCATASPTSRGERRAATSRSSGRCTRSSATSIWG